MSDPKNHKNHSTTEIENAISKALSDLFGLPYQVKISKIDFRPIDIVKPRANESFKFKAVAKYSRYAVPKPEPRE